MNVGSVLTEIPDGEVAVKAALKAARMEIRLKYSLLADAEIAEEIPKLERQLKGLAAGETFTLELTCSS